MGSMRSDSAKSLGLSWSITSSGSPIQNTRCQSGYVYHYAFAMLLGIAVMTTWYVVIMARG